MTPPPCGRSAGVIPRRIIAALFDSCVVAATVVGIGLVALRVVEFGAKAGGWVYQYVASPDVRTAVAAGAGTLLVVGAHAWLRRRATAHPVAVVLAVLGLGVVCQLGLRALAPASMAAVVQSNVANSFYAAAARVEPSVLLADFHGVSAALPLHAQHNMPGKVLLYSALRAVTKDPGVIAVVIVVVSSLGGVFIYAIAARTIGSPASGVDAMLLWMLVPSKASFHPLLNVVSPVPALAAVWCMTQALSTRSTSRIAAWALVAGTLAYATGFFDPLALWIGVVFAPLVLRAAATHTVRVMDALVLVAAAATAAVATHHAVRAATGFDVVAELARQAAIFEDQRYRPYDVWVIANLKDLALAAGPAVTVAFVGACGLVLWDAARGRLAGGAVVTLMTVLVVVALEALGFERGEVPRLWIFVLAPVQVAVAWCLARSSGATPTLVIGGTFAYATLTVATVGYCLP